MEPSITFWEDGRIWTFSHPPEAVIQAETLSDVIPALREVESFGKRGFTCVGFVSYEASPAFDSALQVRRSGLFPTPLVYFHCYFPSVFSQRHGETGAHRGENFHLYETAGDDVVEAVSLLPLWAENVYTRAFAEVHRGLDRGDIYQANIAFPVFFKAPADSEKCFRIWSQSQGRGKYFHFRTATWEVICLSPETFFTLEDQKIVSCPMKGTRRRGRRLEEDDEYVRELRTSAKECAENLMITDMVRNDLGRIARVGSVRVVSLFEVQKLRTVWQMISRVSAETSASLVEIFAALFPAASVTGAPKIKAMEYIARLEPTPRGVYCGAVGIWGPGRKADFRVAIRTITVDKTRQVAYYPVGSGITWDAQAHEEYRECLQKAWVLTKSFPTFCLLESLLWDNGYRLLEEHLARLGASAAYFDYPCNLSQIQAALDDVGKGLSRGRYKVRLLLHSDGRYEISAEPLEPTGVWRIRWARSPVDSTDIFLYHKTTWRKAYEAHTSAREGVEDVLLYNERGEVTESTVANVVLAKDGRKITPALECGLLGGTFRKYLLAQGEIQEAIVRREDVERAERIWLINSVRGWIPCVLVE